MMELTVFWDRMHVVCLVEDDEAARVLEDVRAVRPLTIKQVHGGVAVFQKVDAVVSGPVSAEGMKYQVDHASWRAGLERAVKARIQKDEATEGRGLGHISPGVFR